MLRLRLLLTLIIAGSLTLPLQAATITVAGDGASIQMAIDAAVSGQDEVVVSPGTYLEAINFNGKAITLRSASGDPADTIIDGGGNGSVVTCDSGETSTTVLDGFTITNGSATYGGGMYNSNSSPTVTNCTFSGNDTTYGDSIISHGGGMFNSSSSPAVTNCTFSDNDADYGGGMSNSSSSPTVTNCTFSGNDTTYGGGMFNYISILTVTNCTFSGNTAYAGGGMSNNSSSPTVTNCTFSGNTAYAGGGGMNNLLSSPILINCTFSSNKADHSGGGMYNYNSSSPTVTNCILWGDSPNEIINYAGSMPTISYSDLQGGLPENTVDGGGNINADPLFLDADGLDNTAGTGDDDLSLSGGSPCIDSGSFFDFNRLFDLGGNYRYVDEPTTINTGSGVLAFLDMGVYEFQVPPCSSLPGDINCDGIVNLLDLALLALHWLETN